MSWLYSRALVEEYSEDISWDGEPCAQSRSTDSAGMSWSLDRTTDVLSRSRSGMTYEPLTDEVGEDVLTWCLEGFLVPTYRAQEEEQDLTENNPVFGPKCGGLLARFDPDTSSLKTPQCLLFEEGQESLVTLPNWGSMQDGELWEHTIPAHLTSGTGFGFLATPTAKANQLSPSMIKHPGCRAWSPTPTANEDAAGTPDGKMQQMLGNHPGIRGTTQKEWDGGTLNPNWVEWLMGWPIGWTDLEQLVTGKCQLALH